MNVSVAAAAKYVVSTPANAIAGSTITVTVTAKDASNNTVTGYTGTVHFTSSDPAAVLPANATLTNGVGTFTVTLKTAGSQKITATDAAFSSITGSSGIVSISPAAVTHLAVVVPAGMGTAGTVVAGNQFSYTVTAEDVYNNPVPGYAGTIRFASSDPTAAFRQILL